MPEPGPLQLNFAAPKRGRPPRHFADLAPDERAAAVTELGLPAFRAKQLSTHYYGGFSTDPLTWTDLPAGLREPIREALFPPLLTFVRSVSCDGGATVKTLWKLHDGTLVESVLMRYGLRRDGTPGSHGVRSTLCVSSQAGCGMACPFCATGQGGLDRNLSTAEIVDQVRAACAALGAGDLPGGPGRLNNVVFMGMGEPMDNLDAVLLAVDRLIENPVPGLAEEHVTVSTSGVLPGLKRFLAEGRGQLAVTLSATTDAVREQLIPHSRHWPISDLLAALAADPRACPGRRHLIAYVLWDSVNDSDEDAHRLGQLLMGLPVHINLIPHNPVPSSALRPSSAARIKRFHAILRAHKLPCVIRQPRGPEIAAACGQLALRTASG